MGDHFVRVRTDEIAFHAMEMRRFVVGTWLVDGINVLVFRWIYFLLFRLRANEFA